MTLTTQFMTMLTMGGMGILFGANLDTYNRFLNRTKRKQIIVFMNDILFWIVQGLVIFYVLFLVNRGELRFYIFLALLCGFAAYQSLFKKLYLHVLEIIINMVISIYRFIIKLLHTLIYKPIYSLVMGIISLVILLGKGLYSLFKWLLNLLLWIIRTIFLPILWIFKLVWNLLPKNLKKFVNKFYNRLAGVFLQTKNIYTKWVNKWKNKGE